MNYSSLEDEKDSKSNIDYNYVVDEILKGSHAYNTEHTPVDVILADPDFINSYKNYRYKKQITLQDKTSKENISDDTSPLLTIIDALVEEIEQKNKKSGFKPLYSNSIGAEYFPYENKSISNEYIKEMINAEINKTNFNLLQSLNFKTDSVL